MICCKHCGNSILLPQKDDWKFKESGNIGYCATCNDMLKLWEVIEKYY